ncbi:hypothetical protein [Luteibacter sp. 9133]|uniref:hypothetical protein n=1 Tax=Luteibacter sp. 9133 TaxID=1500891 RepID=UPI0005B84583|nr:hypothetical protein [Luteibacter sp. 9133]
MSSNQVQFLSVGLCGIAVLVLVVWRLLHQTKRRDASFAIRPGAPPIVPVGSPKERASRIVVGITEAHPAFELGIFPDAAAFDRAPSVPGKGRIGPLTRMGAMLQAAPSLLVAEGHRGRQLMEVVINSPLANAASGSHLLPYARGADGKVIELAKLFNPEGLKSLVNSAAVWQVASVVVAQKHMADISRKLDELKKGIDDIKGMLEDAFTGELEGMHRYLVTVARTVAMGDIPKDALTSVHASTNRLMQMERTLVHRFERRLGQQIEHGEMVGTGDLLTDTLRRYDDLDHIRRSLVACLKTEVLAWHVLSLFPGNDAFCDVLADQIRASIHTSDAMAATVGTVADRDASAFNAFFNLESTLEERRKRVRERGNETQGSLADAVSTVSSRFSDATLLLEHRDDSIRLGVEFIDGQMQDVRVLA